MRDYFISRIVKGLAIELILKNLLMFVHEYYNGIVPDRDNLLSFCIRHKLRVSLSGFKFKVGLDQILRNNIILKHVECAKLFASQLIQIFFKMINSYFQLNIPGKRRRKPVALPKNCHIRDGSKFRLFWNVGFKSWDHLIAFKTSGAVKYNYA